MPGLYGRREREAAMWTGSDIDASTLPCGLAGRIGRLSGRALVGGAKECVNENTVPAAGEGDGWMDGWVDGGCVDGCGVVGCG